MEVVPLREAGVYLAAIKALCCSYNILTSAPTSSTSPTTGSPYLFSPFVPMDKVFLLQLQMLCAWDGLLLLLRGTCSIPCA